jgi:unsaturated pyranuronate lyase
MWPPSAPRAVKTLSEARLLLILVMGKKKPRLSAGDLFTVPANVPHAVQTLSPHVRLVDAFNPIREDFLKR